MKITFAIIIATFIVFGFQSFLPAFTDAFALIPELALGGAWWQFFTYMFLHGGAVHIILNMFILAIFGPVIEHRLGKRFFLLLYILAGLGSAALYISLTGVFSGPLSGFLSQTMLGASGAVFGILTAYGYLYPKNIILVFFVPMPAIFAIILITAFELVSGILGIFPGIANFGHIGGIVTGVLFMLLWRFIEKKIPIDEREPRTYEFVWE